MGPLHFRPHPQGGVVFVPEYNALLYLLRGPEIVTTLLNFYLGINLTDIPVIGRVPNQPNIFVAAGHFKKGIMLAPVTGKLMADLMTRGTTNLPIAPLDPARFA